jgi:hypothetical protein
VVRVRLCTEVDDDGHMHLKGPGIDYVNEDANLDEDSLLEWLSAAVP